jgi:24-methylenesterol C-methyltransferase
MPTIDLTPVTARLQPAIDSFNGLSTQAKYAITIAGAGSAIVVLGAFITKREYKRKPGSLELSGGALKSSEVKKEFDAFTDAYGANAGDGILDKSKTPQLVDVFYSLVTDIYEWGWGQSFHFSPKLPGKCLKASEAAHEARVATAINLHPGQKCLDAGCGVGGPMRTIASVSGAHVTGITINEYQVQRAKHHNEKVRACCAPPWPWLRDPDGSRPFLQQGVASITDVVRGNFLEMPFDDATFDGAYAIEATCHSPKVCQRTAESCSTRPPPLLSKILSSHSWTRCTPRSTAC